MSQLELESYLTSPLWYAAERGDFEELRRLVEEGHNVNKRDEWGRTPLMYAADKGHTDCVEYLLQNGAQLLADFNHMTAFDLASRRGHGSTVKLLQTAAHKAKGE